ncbi:MAG: sensor histidine kinase, partial [Gammaproteobacteria bacterium]|nr:sensor histidine kinase [Gammaproteobacteria bacterium]
VHIGASAEEGGVCLQVSDDGRGIEPELLGRIFEPRFSTSSTGTGLGLAIVQRLVRSWGGRVWAESTPRVGTTMSIRFAAWEPGPRTLVSAAGTGRTMSNPQD